jgi:phosphatidylinositol-bisphosphatase
MFLAYVSFCRHLLLLTIIQGLVLPQQEITLTIRILVSQKIAADLNIGPRRLEHTLILRTALGKDHFLAVGGEYRTLPWT